MSFLIKKNYTNLFLSYLNLTFQKRSCKTKMLVWRVVWWQQYRIWTSQMCRKSVPITRNYRRDRKIFWQRRKLSFRLEFTHLLVGQFFKFSFFEILNSEVIAKILNIVRRYPCMASTRKLVEMHNPLMRVIK